LTISTTTTSLTYTFNTLLYNGIPTTTPTVTVHYEWEANRNGTLKKLEQSITIKDTRYITTEYDAEHNQTKILDGTKEDDKRALKTTKSGLVLPTISTNNEVISSNY
jgi:hypothetical protein